METIVCQAAQINAAEAAVEAQVAVESISTLSSAEMSFVGGGSLTVVFA
jgi:hypothetical protein